MLEALEGIDRGIVLFVNGWHTPFLDTFFWIISKTGTWIPFYAILIYLTTKYYGWKNALIFAGLSFAMVALVDSTTTFLFKETIRRYRPSHHAWLTEKLHFYRMANGDFYKGGQYGFFSSHASNNAAIAVFSWLTLRNYMPRLKWFLLAGVTLICLSRLYLSVHYLSDLVAGVIWGTLWAYLVYWIFTKVQRN